MSMRYWSGTSTARPGTNRAASIASTSSTPQTTWAGRPTSAAGAGEDEERHAGDDPDPQHLLGATVQGAGDPGRHGRDQAGDTDDRGELLGLGRPRDGERRGRGERGRRHRALRRVDTRAGVRRGARCPRGPGPPRRARRRRCARRTSPTARRPPPRRRTRRRRTTRAPAVSSLRRRSDDRSPRRPSATGDPAATSTAPLVRPSVRQRLARLGGWSRCGCATPARTRAGTARRTPARRPPRTRPPARGGRRPRPGRAR